MKKLLGLLMVFGMISIMAMGQTIGSVKVGARVRVIGEYSDINMTAKQKDENGNVITRKGNEVVISHGKVKEGETLNSQEVVVPVKLGFDSLSPKAAHELKVAFANGTKEQNIVLGNDSNLVEKVSIENSMAKSEADFLIKSKLYVDSNKYGTKKVKLSTENAPMLAIEKNNVEVVYNKVLGNESKIY